MENSAILQESQYVLLFQMNYFIFLSFHYISSNFFKMNCIRHVAIDKISNLYKILLQIKIYISYETKVSEIIMHFRDLQI